MAQVVDELSHLQDFPTALTVFMNKACRDYDQKTKLDKCLRFRQDRDYE